MFGLGKRAQAQPKSEFEQPEIQVEEVPEEERIQQWNEALRREAKSDPNLMYQVRGPKANPSIISKVWK